MTFDHTHYVPILLTRRGERSALSELTELVKDAMTPLFEVHPIDWNYDIDEPSRSVSEHVAGLGKQLASCWRSARAFIDTTFVDAAEATDHPLLQISRDAAENGLMLVPCVSPKRSAECISAAAQLHAVDQRGVCLRLRPPDWPSSRETIAEIETLLAEISVSPEDTDLILDVGDDVKSDLARTSVRAELYALPHATRWRSLTLAGSAFPKDTSGMARNTITSVPRRDWLLFRSIDADAVESGWRRPVFGDYGVAHPDPSLGVDPKLLSISANLRYTSSDAWLVSKGDLFKGPGGSSLGGAAIVRAAQLLAESEEFCGPNFSAGDRWIADVASSASNGGNPERWRRVATNHHCTFVTRQLASYFEI